MALSGSMTKYFYSNNGYCIILEWTGSQDISGNYTTIYANLYLQSNGSYSISSTNYSKDAHIVIDGTIYSKTDCNVALSSNQKKWMMGATHTVYHNADGTRSVTLDGDLEININLSQGNPGTVYMDEQSWALDTIPRASSLSSSPSWTAPNNLSVTIGSASSGFTHTVTVWVKNASGSWVKIGDRGSVATSTTFEFTTAENNLIFGALAQAASRESAVGITTFSGGTQIGYNEYYGTCTNAGATTLSSGQSWTAGNDTSLALSTKHSSFSHSIEIKVNAVTIKTVTAGGSVGFTLAENTSIFTQLAQAVSKATSIVITTKYDTSTVGVNTYAGTCTNPGGSTLTTSADWTAGSDFTLSITKALAAFTHTAKIYVNSTLIKTITGIDISAGSAFSLAENTTIFTQLAQTASKATSISLESYYNGVLAGSKSYTGTCTAPAASTITSSANFNIGDNVVVNVNRVHSSFTHTVVVKLGTTSIKTISSVGTTTTWAPTTTEKTNMYNTTPSSNTIGTTIELTTYYNGVKVRSTTSITGTATVTNSNPTFGSTYTYADTNATTTTITGNNQYIVQNKSTLVVTMTTAQMATAVNSATMASYVATLNGIQQTAAHAATTITFNFGTIDASSNLTLSIKAIDSRGNSTTTTKVVNILPYNPPVVTTSAIRVNNFENNTIVKLNGSFSLLPISAVNKNALTLVQYRYKETSASTWSPDWTAFPHTVSGSTYSATDLTIPLDNTKSYNVEVKTADKLVTTTVSMTVNIGIPIFFIDSDKKSVGINAFPDILNGLVIGGDMKITGGITEGGTTLANKYAAKSHGNHVPTVQTANNAIFLRNDNTWQTITPANIGAAATSHGSHVPTPQTANNAIFLRNDNTWQTITPANIGAAATSHSHSYLPLTGGTVSGQTTFSNGINVGSGEIIFSDVSDYWLVTATNWGLYWNTTDNRLEFHGAGAVRHWFDLDDGTASLGGLLTGRNSIRFDSLANAGSDYGFIRYDDDNNAYAWWGDGNENSALVIGVQNDGRTAVSDVIALESPAGVMIGSELLFLTSSAAWIEFATGRGWLQGQGNGQIKVGCGANGTMDFGPANTGWAHFYTDRTQFYFDRAIQVNGYIQLYSGLGFMGHSNEFNGNSGSTTWLSYRQSSGAKVGNGGGGGAYGPIYGSSKNAITATPTYGEVVTYADESPNHVFHDAGSGYLDENGECYVFLDPIYLETVTTKRADYLLFITGYTGASVEIKEKQSTYFVVVGTPGKRFDWLIRAERTGMERLRWNDADIYI